MTVTPGATYSGFVWFRRVNYGWADGLLQVTQPDGTVIVEDTLLAGDFEWHRLAVSFVAPGNTVKFRIGLQGDRGETRYFVLDDATLIEGTVGDLANTGFEDGLDAWTIVGANDGTVVPVTVGGDTAIQITSVTGQPVGVEQWFDGYDDNAASAAVSLAGGSNAQVVLEVLRSDGTVVETWPVALDIANPTATIGGVGWSSHNEDILIYRITTTGAGDVLVDWTNVGLTT